MGRWLTSALVAAASLGAAAGSARADDDVDAVLDRTRTAMRAEKWDTAVQTLKDLLARGPETPGLHARMAEVERELMVCLYRQQALRPEARDLFGAGATKLATYGRRIEFRFPRGPSTATGWRLEGDIWVLPFRLEKEITLDFEGDAKNGDSGNLFLLFWDSDKETGYRFVPGFAYISGSSVYSLDGGIDRMDGSGNKSLDKGRFQNGAEYLARSFERTTQFTLTCKPPKLEMKWAQGSMKASDSAYREGLLVVRASGVKDLTVKSIVTEVELASRLASFHEEGFARWQRSEWDRKKVLPAWALEAPKIETEVFVPPVPRGVPPETAGGYVEALGAFHAGENLKFLLMLPRLAGKCGGGEKYLRGLAFLALGAPRSAEAEFTAFLEGRPDFAAAKALRAVARYECRDLEGARADIEAAAEADVVLPELSALRAAMAIAGGSLEKARAIGDEARRRGVLLGEMRSIDDWVRRSLRGPEWQKRFEYSNDHATVHSDHSVDLCRDVAVLLGAGMQACGKEFPQKRPSSPPVRVYVFSSRDAYLKYAGETGRDLASTAGAYIPWTRELVLFLPEGRAEGLWRTVKHETFHAFLHGFVEDAPTWFNEGWAQWFENAKARGEARLEDGIEKDVLRTLEALGGSRALVPLEKFMVMDHPTFMAGAELHYAQAVLLVTFLNEDRSRWKQPLRQYADSLFAGASAKEAFDEHWKSLLFDMEREFRAFVLKRVGK